MGTSMVGENGEYELDLESNPMWRFTEARERTNLTECSSGGVAEEDAEDDEEAELDSGGNKG